LGCFFGDVLLREWLLERVGKRDGNVTLLLNAIGPFEDPMAPEKLMTTDPAFWDDWLTAVEQARTKGLPAEL
jgi:hypothetical protein